MSRLYLDNQEPSDAFGEPALLAGQNHLQHVSVELLHDHENVSGRFKHPFQHHNAMVGQILSNNTTMTQSEKAFQLRSAGRRRVNTCRMATSFLSCLSCWVGKRVLSMTLMATERPSFL